MMIEERLRQDAARCSVDGAAPPFEDFLDVATAARRPRGTWLAVAAAVAAIALVATAIAIQPWQARRPATGSGRTAHIEGIAVLAVVRAGTDPRRLTVWTKCTVTAPAAKGVATYRGWVVTVAGTMPIDHGDVTACSTPPTPVALELPAPLGDRDVFSGDSVVPVPVLSAGELPAPGYLPPGYRADGVQPIAPGDGRFVGERDYLDGTDRIVVMVGPTEQLPAYDLVSRRAALTTVNGHSALITFESGTCVTWTIRSSVDEAVCAIGHPDANLPTSEVVKIARSLP